MRTALIEKVNRLVRKETVCDIPLRQRHRAADNGIRHADTMEMLVVGTDAHENIRRLGQRRLRHGDGLEAALKSGVLFNIFTVFDEGRRADDLNFPAREGRLQNIRGVHRAFRVAGSDQVVHLVDKQNNVALGLHLVHESLDAALKLAAELRARDESRQVKQMNLFLAQTGRHISRCNAQGKALGNGRLADARLADKAGIVLCTAAQNLHHAANLAVTADDGVDLARSRFGGEIRAIRIEMAALRERFLLSALLHRLLRRLIGLALLRRLPHTGENALQEIREGSGSAGAEGTRLFPLFAVSVRVHQLTELRLHRVELLLVETHLVKKIVDGLDPELLRARQAKPLRLPRAVAG